MLDHLASCLKALTSAINGVTETWISLDKYRTRRAGQKLRAHIEITKLLVDENTPSIVRSNYVRKTYGLKYICDRETIAMLKSDAGEVLFYLRRHGRFFLIPDRTPHNFPTKFRLGFETKEKRQLAFKRFGQKCIFSAAMTVTVIIAMVLDKNDHLISQIGALGGGFGLFCGYIADMIRLRLAEQYFEVMGSPTP